MEADVFFGLKTKQAPSAVRPVTDEEILAKEDWFQAESELLRPVSITTLKLVDQLSLRANVFGFGEKELMVSVEPKRVVILGKKGAPTTQTEARKTERVGGCTANHS